MTKRIPLYWIMGLLIVDQIINRLMSMRCGVSAKNVTYNKSFDDGYVADQITFFSEHVIFVVYVENSWTYAR